MTNEELKALRKDMEGLKFDVGELKKGQKQLFRRVDGLEQKVGTMDRRVDRCYI